MGLCSSMPTTYPAKLLNISILKSKHSESKILEKYEYGSVKVPKNCCVIFNNRKTYLRMVYPQCSCLERSRTPIYDSYPIELDNYCVLQHRETKKLYVSLVFLGDTDNYYIIVPTDI